MKRIKTLLAITTLSFIAVSCNKTACENTNLIFSQYSPHAKEYKDELVKQISQFEKSGLSFWLDSYHKDNSSEYIIAQIEGDGLCAKIVLSIKDSKNGIENVVEHGGMGYHGARLQELEFEVIQNETKTEFVFRRVGDVLD